PSGRRGAKDGRRETIRFSKAKSNNDGIPPRTSPEASGRNDKQFLKRIPFSAKNYGFQIHSGLFPFLL
ncbi:MAG TPA: hypothetical protein VF985_02720, partial [Mariniflexile sp.]